MSKSLFDRRTWPVILGVMKNPLTPGKSTPVKSWTDFASLARDTRHFDTTTMEITSSADHAALLKALSDASRPYAVCILKAK